MFDELLIKTGFFLIKIYMYAQIIFLHVYERYLKGSWIVDITRNITYEINRCIYEDKIEPPYPYWSISCHEGKFKEYISNILDTQPNIEQQFNERLNAFMNTDTRENAQYLFIMKIGNLCISRIYMPSRIACTISSEKTRNQFLSIEYIHPLMDEKIVIDLNSSLYLIGNEILSADFIERYLEYQNIPFVFDYDYSIEIMDSKINTFTIKYGQYILLNKTNYEILDHKIMDK